MKKLLLVVVLALLLVMPLTATNTSIINAGYTLVGHFMNLTEGGGIYLHSAGLTWIHLKAGDSSAGLYTKVNPNVTMFYSRADGTSSLIEGLMLHVDSIIGYGVDLDWGNWGLILGGGGYVRVTSMFDGGMSMFFGFGIGAGANMYFNFNEKLFFNFGLAGSWVPVCITFGEGLDGTFAYRQFAVILNTGLGWRY